MRYFAVERLTSSDPDYYFIESRPKGLGLNTWQMSKGERANSFWPKPAPKVLPSDRNEGLKLPDLISTTHGYLVVSAGVRKVIEAHHKDCEIEYLPIDLSDNKKRTISTDYCFVNPIGCFDCLHAELSEINYNDKREVISVDKIVLDPKKMKNAPAMFRILEDPSVYVVSEKLAEALGKQKFTNVELHELEQAPTKTKA